MNFVCSLLVVDNIEKSKIFYEKLMRQKIKYDFTENITFEGGFVIHLKSHFSDLINNRKIIKAGNNFELYFEYDDIDLFVKELIENNVEIVHNVHIQPWGQKVVRFYDPDKHIIEVGESLEFLTYRLSKEGKSDDEISKITGLTIEFISESIIKNDKNRRKNGLL